MAPPRKTVVQYEAEAQRRENGCWIHSAHSVARKVWQLRNNCRLLTSEYVCHTCDEPYCIEPTHHFIGSAGDNVRDAVAKGRHSCFHPNVYGAPKFTRPRTADEKQRIGEGLKKAYADGRKQPPSPEQMRRMNAGRKWKI